MKFRQILGTLDSPEWHVYGGLALGGVGGWVFSPAWTFIIVGATLVLWRPRMQKLLKAIQA